MCTGEIWPVFGTVHMQRKRNMPGGGGGVKKLRQLGKDEDGDQTLKEFRNDPHR